MGQAPFLYLTVCESLATGLDGKGLGEVNAAVRRWGGLAAPGRLRALLEIVGRAGLTSEMHHEVRARLGGAALCSAAGGVPLVSARVGTTDHLVSSGCCE